MKYLIVFLIFLILITPVYSATVFWDDFDGESDGDSPPANWTKQTATDCNIKEVDNANSFSPSNSFLMSNGASTTNGRIYCADFGDDQYAEEWEVMVYVDDAARYYYPLITYSSDGTGALNIYFRNDNSIRAYNDGVFTDTGYNYVTDAWYKIRVKADWTGDSFDAWYNDTQIIDDWGIYDNSDGFDRICVGINTATTAWYDNVNVTNSTPVAEPPETLTTTMSSPLNTSYCGEDIWINATTDNTSTDWCGYSIDGLTNVTMTNSSGNWNALWSIGSNCSDNTHNITVYCNSTSGLIDADDTLWFWSCCCSGETYEFIYLPFLIMIGTFVFIFYRMNLESDLFGNPLKFIFIGLAILFVWVLLTSLFLIAEDNGAGIATSLTWVTTSYMWLMFMATFVFMIMFIRYVVSNRDRSGE